MNNGPLRALRSLQLLMVLVMAVSSVAHSNACIATGAMKASSVQLETWAEAIFDAQSVEDLLK